MILSPKGSDNRQMNNSLGLKSEAIGDIIKNP